MRGAIRGRMANTHGEYRVKNKLVNHTNKLGRSSFAEGARLGRRKAGAPTAPPLCVLSYQSPIRRL